MDSSYTGGSFNTILGISIVGLVIFLLSIFNPIKLQNTDNKKRGEA